MFKEIVHALQNGVSPLLLTGIGTPNLGTNCAVIADTVIGDASLLPDRSAIPDKLPCQSGDVLIERIVTAPELVLCGGGHVSVQTAKVAKLCGFSVTVIDERGEFANAERFPQADRIINLPFSEALEQIQSPSAYYVIVTRGHKDDRACLEQILQRSFVYCGMIGSRTKVGVVFSHLLDNGYSSAQIAKVHAPIGLSIGAVTPEDIAVSIVGELIQVKNGGMVGTEWDESLCREILSSKESYAMVTLISKSGSAPRSTGARMIVRRDGTIISSIGGGFGEYEASQYAIEMLQNHTAARRYTCRMTNRDAAEAGMVCGGTVDVLIQTIEED